jgi:hypothetical protein
MTLKEKILFHQVHPAKLATDIGASIVSLYFFWRHELVIGLLAHFVPPPIGSFFVIRFADLESYKNSRLGSYPVAVHDARCALIGDLIAVFAAWYHSPLRITAGFELVLCARLYGFPSFRCDG